MACTNGWDEARSVYVIVIRKNLVSLIFSVRNMTWLKKIHRSRKLNLSSLGSSFKLQDYSDKDGKGKVHPITGHEGLEDE